MQYNLQGSIPTSQDQRNRWKEYWQPNDPKESAEVHLQRLRVALDAAEMLTGLVIKLLYCAKHDKPLPEMTMLTMDCAARSRGGCRECIMVKIAKLQRETIEQEKEPPRTRGQPLLPGLEEETA